MSVLLRCTVLGGCSVARVLAPNRSPRLSACRQRTLFTALASPRSGSACPELCPECPPDSLATRVPPAILEKQHIAYGLSEFRHQSWDWGCFPPTESPA